ncbi:MAG: hypothetical protein KAJ98_06785, partial [Spirochaetaceae bacterium]|nr:hypothetical protein [Spirochaetaceae bacterium]
MTPSGRNVTPDILNYFNIEVMNNGIRDVRISAIISSIAFLLFNILDRFIYPELAWLFLQFRLIVLAGNA